MRLKDVIHFYIGSPYFIFPEESITDGFLDKYKKQYPTGVYAPILPLDKIKIDSILRGGYKLVLRQLSDMKEEELREICEIMEYANSKLPFFRRQKSKTWVQWYCVWDNKETIVANLTNDINGLTIYGNNYYRCYLKVFPFLLKQGFDLFGLINSKQAIDAETLYQKIIKENERKSGLYWTKIRGHWEISKYYSDKNEKVFLLLTCSLDDGKLFYTDQDFEQINETPIIPPTN